MKRKPMPSKQSSKKVIIGPVFAKPEKGLQNPFFKLGNDATVYSGNNRYDLVPKLFKKF